MTTEEMVVPSRVGSGLAATYALDKITPDHLRREAVVYIRVSTDKQVENNKESLRYQMNLTGRALHLGWPADRVRVINDDLGVSAVYGNRKGFLDLLTDTAYGEIGIIFIFDSSRAVRRAGDMHVLVDAAIDSGTLIADNSTIYDPRLFNDRMMLYMSGLFSEAECHYFHLRGAEGRMLQVRRGEYRQRLPTGLVRLPDGEVVKHPDERVQEAISLVLRKFKEIGSCGKVLRQLSREKVELPAVRYHGMDRGRVVWSSPTRSAIYGIVRTAAYAGAFVYGQKPTVRTGRRKGARHVPRVTKPMEEWIVIQNVYPAYITWEQYLANLRRLKELAATFNELVEKSPGDAREGAALLVGLAQCGLCGARMNVTYNPVARYFCDAQRKNYGAFSCASLHAPSIDAAVVEAFFEALRPAQVDALETVLTKRNEEAERLRRQWERRIRQALYEAGRAELQFELVDPQNRLVASQLERRWQEKLTTLGALKNEYQQLLERQQAAGGLTPEVRRQLQTISESLREPWREGKVTNSQKKELLRSLISSVVLRRVTADMTEVRIAWVSGGSKVIHAGTPTHQTSDLPAYEEMVGRIKTLWGQQLDDRSIAAQLTAEGFHSARSQEVLPDTVQGIRRRFGWISPLQKRRADLTVDGYLTATGLAARLGVGLDWVYRRLETGRIEGKYLAPHKKQHVWLIKDAPELIERLRSEAARRRRGWQVQEH